MEKIPLPHAIIIPGGGQTKERTVLPHVRKRLEEALRLYEKHKAYLVCLSGGTTHKPNPRDPKGFDSRESSAGVRFLLEAGVPAHHILEESTSLDTIANAFFCRCTHTDPAGLRSLVVITNEFHMPRTRAIFDFIFGLPTLSALPLLHAPGPMDEVEPAPRVVVPTATRLPPVPVTPKASAAAGAGVDTRGLEADSPRAISSLSHLHDSGYTIRYVVVPDGDAELGIMDARRKKEAAALEAFLEHSAMVTCVSDLHRWLFVEHNAYAAKRFVDDEETARKELDLDPALLATY